MEAEVLKIIEPVKKELLNLTKENKTLKTEITLLKANLKSQTERINRTVQVVNRHQDIVEKNDRDDRSKRLLFGAVPEEPITINNVACDEDQDKVNEILRLANSGYVKPASVKRIGKKEDGRPRYISVDFSCRIDRNKVKNNSKKLNQHPYFNKAADRTKLERDEYKRLLNMYVCVIIDLFYNIISNKATIHS